MSRWGRAVRYGLLLLAGLGAGCRSTENAADRPTVVPRFYLEAGADTAGTPLALPRSGVQLRVNAKPVITEGDVQNVELVQVDLGRCLRFELVPGALRDFYRLTGSHQGRRLVLTLNGDARGARRIDGAIADGVLYIFVEVPDEELAALAAELKRGAAVTQRELRRKG